MISSDRELDALERIHLSQHPVHQRDLAQIIGLSLGMTNAILKRLAQKGLLQVRKVNNRNIQYVVSAKGMEEIAHRSYSYLKRTIKNVVYYKEAIDRLLSEAATMGYRRLLLVGNSDLDFIVEHLCAKHHLAYQRLRALPSENPMEPVPRAGGGKDFVLYSENSRPPNGNSQNYASLRALFSARPPARGQSGGPQA
jgi:DNA-binding MarR family transcriptional regulator